MADNRFTGDLRGAEFRDASLRGARFVSADLSEVVMRGILIERAEIDSPWLVESGEPLLVNGVDVTAYVDAQLDLRFPGRELRRAADPAGLLAAWAVLEESWAQAVARAEAMPAGTVDVSVADEWTFAQTLRHLVMAIDTWLRKAVLEIEQPYHPLGLAHAEFEADGNDVSVFSDRTPTFAEVLDAWGERRTMVRDHLSGLDDAALDQPRRNPHDPEHTESVRSCLHTILEESWEHLRYAVRDLDAIEAGHAARADRAEHHG